MSISWSELVPRARGISCGLASLLDLTHQYAAPKAGQFSNALALGVPGRPLCSSPHISGELCQDLVPLIDASHASSLSHALSCKW